MMIMKMITPRSRPRTVIQNRFTMSSRITNAPFTMQQVGPLKRAAPPDDNRGFQPRIKGRWGHVPLLVHRMMVAPPRAPISIFIHYRRAPSAGGASHIKVRLRPADRVGSGRTEDTQSSGCVRLPLQKRCGHFNDVTRSCGLMPHNAGRDGSSCRVGRVVIR